MKRIGDSWFTDDGRPALVHGWWGYPSRVMDAVGRGVQRAIRWLIAPSDPRT